MGGGAAVVSGYYPTERETTMKTLADLKDLNAADLILLRHYANSFQNWSFATMFLVLWGVLTVWFGVGAVILLAAVPCWFMALHRYRQARKIGFLTAREIRALARQLKS